jgi:hypothetical protein
MSKPEQEWKRDLKRKICHTFLHKNLFHWVTLNKPSTYCTKSSFSKTFRFKGLQVFKFLDKRSGGTLHCCIQWGIGYWLNGSNEPWEFQPQRPYLDRFLIIDDMHWSSATNGSWPFTWMYGVNSGLCNRLANL